MDKRDKHRFDAVDAEPWTLTGREQQQREREQTEREEPYRAPNVQSDVAVPLLTGVIVGGLVASIVVVVGVLMGWPLPFERYVLLWLLLFLVLTLARFWWHSRWLQGTIMRWERWSGKDLPGGYRGGPGPLFNPDEARQKANKARTAIEEQNDVDELIAFFNKAYTAPTPSEQNMGVGTSPRAREEYTRLRDRLMELHLAAWKKPGDVRGGWRLTVTPETAKDIIEQHVLRRG
jgi:hypothetical protein